MQKIDFVKNLDTIVEKLQSKAIVEIFQKGFAQPNQNYSYGLANPLLFKSKSNFDQLITEEKYSAILESLNSKSIYEEQNLSRLTTILRTAQANSVLLNAHSVDLYNFHNSLTATLKLSKEILISKDLDSNFQESIENGIVIFQILIETEGLETEKYIKIFTAFNELITTISKIFNETEDKPEIILLDSGSDTNVGIKTGIETAKSLFLIFKEIWDYVTSYKHYKESKKNNALLDSLSIRAEIQKKVDDGIITKEEGLEYTHMVKTRTDDLIGMKVLPKKIVTETNQIENKKLLTEFEGLKLISSKDEK
jgi:hypothetical protein